MTFEFPGIDLSDRALAGRAQADAMQVRLDQVLTRMSRAKDDHELKAGEMVAAALRSHIKAIDKLILLPREVA